MSVVRPLAINTQSTAHFLTSLPVRTDASWRNVSLVVISHYIYSVDFFFVCYSQGCSGGQSTCLILRNRIYPAF